MGTRSIETPTISLETKTTLMKHLLSYNFNSIYGNDTIFYRKKNSIYIYIYQCTTIACTTV